MTTGSNTDVVRECRELVVAITQLSDHGEAAKATSLFVEDGTWLRADILYRGHREILRSFEAFPPTQIARHLIGTPFVSVESDGARASSVTYYTSYVRDPGTANPTLPLPFDGPFTMGEWHDEFALTANGWRFTSRATHRIFQNGPLR